MIESMSYKDDLFSDKDFQIEESFEYILQMYR